MANDCINRQAEKKWCKCEICRVKDVGIMITLFLEPSVIATIINFVFDFIVCIVEWSE